MPMVKAAASKYLAQKWEAESYRTHRRRVHNAPSLLDMAAPRQYPHLQLGVNKIAVQEERQNRYDRENQMLLNKIRVIVKGQGTLNNWNQWARKEDDNTTLHAASRIKRQREIEQANQAMLKRINNTKPVIQRKKHEKDYQKHKTFQSIMEGGVKDYDSPRTRMESVEEYHSEDGKQSSSEKSDKKDDPDSPRRPEKEAEKQENTEDKPPLPADKKPRKKANQQPAENKRKNRQADVPKLPAIE